ncbi:SAM-dependent methyltransferase [Saccharothrix syringae]|uniref:SAM-dependent methyltransferase n=1 Tax=Saccharothrix syringae TaxID=103733 RepID=UPI002AD24337|nr:SAM-dependent methyltransferase [Saccharothrix syringae]
MDQNVPATSSVRPGDGITAFVGDGTGDAGASAVDAPGTAPPPHVSGIGPGVAHPGRATDYLVGGGHNFRVDRDLAGQWLRACPECRAAAVASRAFQRRAVRHAAARGLRRFVDLGCGPGGVGAPHTVLADQPQATVTYVCSDGIEAALGRRLVGESRYAVVLADPRLPISTWTRVLITERCAPCDPVVLVAVGLAEHLDGTGGWGSVLAGWRRILPVGSLLVVSAALKTAARPGPGPERALAAAVERAGWTVQAPVQRANRWCPEVDVDVPAPPVCLAVNAEPATAGPL